MSYVKHFYCCFVALFFLEGMHVYSYLGCFDIWRLHTELWETVMIIFHYNVKSHIGMVIDNENNWV